MLFRSGKANTRRRQLLKYYQAHHNKISQYIDDPESLEKSTERNELANASKPVVSAVEGGNVRTPDERAATPPTTMTRSQTTVSTIRVERNQIPGVEWDEEDRLSQTSYATSTNCSMRIRVPPPPNKVAAFEGEPFECPYCFSIIKIKTRKGWKYVGNYTAVTILWFTDLHLESMYLEIFNPMSAHS